MKFDPRMLHTDFRRHLELSKKAVQAAARGNELFKAGKLKAAQKAWAEHDEHADRAGLIAQKWRR
jgi:hypothetical protein